MTLADSKKIVPHMQSTTLEMSAHKDETVQSKQRTDNTQLLTGY